MEAALTLDSAVLFSRHSNVDEQKVAPRRQRNCQRPELTLSDKTGLANLAATSELPCTFSDETKASTHPGKSAAPRLVQRQHFAAALRLVYV